METDQSSAPSTEVSSQMARSGIPARCRERALPSDAERGANRADEEEDGARSVSR